MRLRWVVLKILGYVGELTVALWKVKEKKVYKDA